MSRLRALLGTLASTYGEPAPLRTADPYEMAIWESVAYLVDDARRAAVFAALKETVGLAPRTLLDAPPGLVVERIRTGGMQPEHRAEKVLMCARLGDEIGVERLATLARTDPKRARRELKRFPGIGDPGADKILMVNGSLVTLAPDSSGLRVLLRVGYGEESKSYSRSYRSACDAALPELPHGDPAWLVRAHQLLRRHGQELCKTNDPRCEVCPVASSCEFQLMGNPGTVPTR